MKTKVLSFLLFLTWQFTSCNQVATYDLNFSQVEPVYFGDYGISNDRLSEKMHKQTTDAGITFTSEKMKYTKGETIIINLDNNSNSSYLICDSTLKFDFYASDKTWVSFNTINNFFLVSDEPAIAGNIAHHSGQFIIDLIIVFPTDQDGEGQSDFIWFMPSEKIQFSLTGLTVTGIFQIRMLCGKNGIVNTWGLNENHIYSNTFTIE